MCVAHVRVQYYYTFEHKQNRNMCESIRNGWETDMCSQAL